MSIESHYPLVPGPFPPIQQTTIWAQSQLTAVDANGTTFSDQSGSQFIGSNVSSDTTTANSLQYPINPFSSTITWRAASFMM
ncbi:hypothetical protein [Marinicella meishanensis]|uniref:hypothetical protein n=1 Tax=Marinicella meishanensis TaxID=2873263 RepID=UPI001CBE018F|nr:hypothetical protein [Marinicella sp. NBU2979]